MSVKCSEVVNFKISMGYYNLLSQMFDEEIKYIRGYKSIANEYFKKCLNFQMSSGSKLGKLPEDFANATWLDSSPYLKLTQQIPKIIQKQIEFLNTFMEEIEKALNSLDDFFKSKSNEIKKYQQKYDDISNDLIKKYVDVERIKLSFLNAVNKSEDLIMKSLENKKKIEDGKNGKLKINENELKLLMDKNKEYESQKKSQINSAKKYENEYKNIIKNSVKIEDKFISVINDCINGIKNITGEITDKLKDTIIKFLESIRDSFKVPLDLIESNLIYMKKMNEKEIMNKAMEATFNYESKLLHITPVRYSLKSLEKSNNETAKRISRGSRGSKGSNGKSKNKNKNKGDNNVDNNQKGFVKFEDGFEEMSYFEDDLTLLTVKEMFNNFELVNHNGLNLQIEEEKNESKKFINKLITNMSQESNKILNDYNFINIDECAPFTEEDKNNLKKLLNKHHNRVIFLHKLNDYRTNSLFELKEKEYQILVELFSFVINISKIEKDYHCVEMAIILSKTYYKLENDKKIYIQNLIKNNDYFKTKDFWEELLIYSISKEIIRSKKRDEDNTIGTEDILNEKNANIVFSQLLSLIDNMFDFDVDGEMIKQIIDPRIEYYKVNDKLKKTIYDVIETKLKSKEKK